MNIVSKTFRSGNSVAVRLPKQFGVEAGVEVLMTSDGRRVTIDPVIEPGEHRARNARLAARLKALGPPVPAEQRKPFDGPERPGMI